MMPRMADMPKRRGTTYCAGEGESIRKEESDDHQATQLGWDMPGGMLAGERFELGRARGVGICRGIGEGRMDVVDDGVEGFLRTRRGR